MTEDIQKIEITTDFIKLSRFMKFADLVYTGGDAKGFIQDGSVMVNGEVCTQRGKKLHDGDVVSFNGEDFLVCVKNG